MLLRISLFFGTGFGAYLGLAAVFGLLCLALGHNNTEMLYGWTARNVLAVTAGILGSWLLMDDASKILRRIWT